MKLQTEKGEITISSEVFTHITGAARLRLKESDRLAAVADGIRRGDDEVIDELVTTLQKLMK